MIQMRWIQVPAGSGRGLFYGADGQVGENVLQFRESIGYNLDNTHYEDFNGVEWQDVKIGGSYGDKQP